MPEGADLTVRMRAAADAPGPSATFAAPGAGLAEFERVLRWQVLPALARRHDARG